ncbi:hypothetical protein P8452_27020 [Trifolium repens]|nr:hypothetical protein P8452_27020 [Trifolium repens]
MAKHNLKASTSEVVSIAYLSQEIKYCIRRKQFYSIISSLQEIMDLGCELFGGSQTCKGVNGDLLVGVWRAMRQHGFRCF